LYCAQAHVSHAFQADIPFDLLDNQAREVQSGVRERVFTPDNTVLTMLLSAIQEDKSLQQGLNTFKSAFEDRCKEALQAEAEQLHQEKINDSQLPRKSGRPKKYQSRLRKSYQKALSHSTAGYATARKKLDIRIVESLYKHSANFGSLDKESWYGMKTYTCTTYEVRV